jgi:NAD(P)-dependent dehydrogenase (short-subunit alcohol dehydrogenase family)
MRLKDKVAIITGGGRGIGRAIAIGFAKEGAKIVVTARTREEIESVANEINNSGGKCIGICCDVSDEKQVKEMIEQTYREFGRIDVLVNNAGIGHVKPVYAIPLESFENIIAVNLTGTFLCTKHVWQIMKSSGGGSIINVSSLGGITAYPFLSAYCASKWGQIGFSKACAEEGKECNIRVNVIAPGKADTAIRAKVPEDKSRMLTAEDHVPLSIFLASDESKYLTGNVIPLEWFGKKKK